MIGKITGTINAIHDETIIIDTGFGVGYCVKYCNHYSIQAGDLMSIFIETVVRENSITLYGFDDYEQILWFRGLTSVSGVGPKVALLILSSMTSDDLTNIVTTGDVKSLSTIKGLGKKTAEKLIVEMSSKISKIKIDISSVSISNKKINISIDNNIDFNDRVDLNGCKVSEKIPKENNDINTNVNNKNKVMMDALLALESLGYKRADVHKLILTEQFSNPNITVEDLIKLILKQMA